MSKTRWCLVGTGDIATKRVGPALVADPKSVLQVVVGRDRSKAAELVERLGVGRAETDFSRVLTEPDIDAVYVATPVDAHFAIAVEALEAGKHVLVEKPPALTVAQCDELNALAEARQTHLGVAYYRRFFPTFATVKQLIADGLLGDILTVRAQYHAWYSPAADDPKHWRVEKQRAGGGPLWDIGCHRIDLIVDLLGMPESVSGVMDTVIHDYEVEDSCTAVLKFPGGAHGELAFFWNTHAWQDRFEIVGTNGRVLLDPCDGPLVEFVRNPTIIAGMGSETTRLVRGGVGNVHLPLIADFTAALAESRAPRITGVEAAKTNRIMDAIERSSTSGRRIEL